MRGPESRIEDYGRDLFRRHGWLYYKMDQGGGVYDRLAISPRAFHLYLEFKRPRKTKLDPAQEHWGWQMQVRINRADVRHPHCAIEGPINSRDAVDAVFEKYKDC